MKKIILIMTAVFFLTSCVVDDHREDNNYTGDEQTYFTENSLVRTTTVTGISDPIVKVEVGSTITSSSDRTYTISVDESSTSVEGIDYSFISNTVTIPSGSYLAFFEFNSLFDTMSDTSNLVLNLEEITDKVSSFKTQMTVKLAKECTANNLLTLEINFDGYASETTWELKDATNTIIFSGGPYGDGDSTISHEICITDGDYSFTIYDAYGDGLFDGATTGSYSLFKGATVFATGQGAFGDCGGLPAGTLCSETTNFTK